MTRTLLVFALLLVACDGEPFEYIDVDAGPLGDSGPPMGEVTCGPAEWAGGEIRPNCPEEGSFPFCVSPRYGVRWTERTQPDGLITWCHAIGRHPECDTYPYICPEGLVPVCIDGGPLQMAPCPVEL